jgi:AcrR family transcriptional regulator
VKAGYERANVNDIAELAGVSIGSLYQYFPSREALFAAVIRRHTKRMIAAFTADLGEIGLLPVDLAARRVIERALAAHAIDAELHKVIVEQVPRTGLLVRSNDFEEEIAFLLRAYLEFHSGALRPMNLDIAVRVLVTTVEAVATEFVLRDPRTVVADALVDELTHMVLRYVKP